MTTDIEAGDGSRAVKLDSCMDFARTNTCVEVVGGLNMKLRPRPPAHGRQWDVARGLASSDCGIDAFSSNRVSGAVKSFDRVTDKIALVDVRLTCHVIGWASKAALHAEVAMMPPAVVIPGAVYVCRQCNVSINR